MKNISKGRISINPVMMPKVNGLTQFRGPSSTTRSEIPYMENVLPDEGLGSGSNSKIVSMVKDFFPRGIFARYLLQREVCEEGFILSCCTLQAQTTAFFGSSDFSHKT